jgi:hypothetical protein
MMRLNSARHRANSRFVNWHSNNRILQVIAESAQTTVVRDVVADHQVGLPHLTTIGDWLEKGGNQGQKVFLPR